PNEKWGSDRLRLTDTPPPSAGSSPAAGSWEGVGGRCIVRAQRPRAPRGWRLFCFVPEVSVHEPACPSGSLDAPKQLWPPLFLPPLDRAPRHLRPHPRRGRGTCRAGPPDAAPLRAGRRDQPPLHLAPHPDLLQRDQQPGPLLAALRPAGPGRLAL